METISKLSHQKKTVSNPILKMKDDTQYLVTDLDISGSSTSKKIIKIFAVVAGCVAVSIGTYSVVSRNHNNVTERESSVEEVAVKRDFLKATTQFVAIPGETCGVHYDLKGESITNGAFGGDRAILGMFRWHATVLEGTRFVCAATIISDTWLIVSGAYASQVYTSYVVEVGILSRHDTVSTFPDKYYIDKVVEKFTDGPKVALIRTRTTMKFNDFVHPICLPTSDLCLASGSELWVSGHGSDYINTRNPYGWTDEDTLLYEKLYLITSEDKLNPNSNRSIRTETSPSWFWMTDPGSPVQGWF